MQSSGVWALRPVADMSQADFQDWQTLLEARTGVVISEQRRAFLQTNLSARMRELAFTRPEARAQLEAIVHPLVTLHCDLQARRAVDQGHPLIVFDIPLLVESGRWARRLDAVLVVDCCAETQIERVMRRSALAREVVQGILASQASRPARRAVADAVITNDRDCSLEQLRSQVGQLARLFGL